MRVLIVDDEEVAITSVRRLIKRRGFRDVDICSKGPHAVKMIREKEYDIVLLDLIMPEMDGLTVLEKSKPFAPFTEFIILTAVDEIDTAVKSVRLGAYDYLVKPVNNERLLLSMERAYERKGLLTGFSDISGNKDHYKIPDAFSEIITVSKNMVKLIAYANIMARSAKPILITGESGTGKELLAHAIHKAGPCPEGPFVPVNVSSIPESLFESQFFGHKKGAYTGAENDHPGFFEQADSGTLFLDEIGELPLLQQTKLLRILEDSTVVRIGSTRQIPVDVRVVSATNKDIDAACRNGAFRMDLMFRLKSAHVHLPPLKERGKDILTLASFFLNKACTIHQKPVTDFSPEAARLIECREYPGNIRELGHLVENAVLVADGPYILPAHLGESFGDFKGYDRTLCSLKENSEIHTAYILDYTKGDKKAAAKILGVTVRQVQRKINQMKLNPLWKEIIEDI